VIALALPATLALAYWLGERRVRAWPLHRTACWVAGVLALTAALSPPMDGWADAGLSAHMVQHLLLTLVAPPMLAAGAPVRLALAALRRPGRRRLARALHTRTARVLASPAFGWAAFSAVMLGTHLTGLYDLALRHPAVHALEHLAFLGSALLFWVPLVGADPLPGRPGSVGRIAWLMAAMPPMGIVGAELLTGPVRYAGYDAADQRTAASIMWAVGSLILALATVVLVFTALVGEERRQQRRDALADRAATT
jgi:cytochrome c oxidase assembly factor CtaG